MTRTPICLNFSDPDLAQDVADSTPPDGVTVSPPPTVIEASAPAEIFTQIVVEFVPQFSAILLAGWLLLALEKRGKKSTRVNRKEVPLKKDDLVQLIQDEIAKQEAREAQWRKEHGDAG